MQVEDFQHTNEEENDDNSDEDDIPPSRCSMTRAQLKAIEDDEKMEIEKEPDHKDEEEDYIE